MSRRVVTAPRVVGVHLTHCAMTGVGLLCYEVDKVSYDLRWHSNASVLMYGLMVRFTFRLFVIYSGSHN